MERWRGGGGAGLPDSLHTGVTAEMAEEKIIFFPGVNIEGRDIILEYFKNQFCTVLYTQPLTSPTVLNIVFADRSDLLKEGQNMKATTS